jgi:hypothetical protein
MTPATAETHFHPHRHVITLEDGSGVHLTREILACDRAVNVVAYSSYHRDVFQDQPLKVGACDFASKNSGILVPVLEKFTSCST